MNFARLLRRISLTLCFLAVFGSVGGHWMIAQSVAWVRMAVEYSQKSSVAQGVKETFDGKHPCGMCHDIRRGKAKEDPQKQNAMRPELKFEVFPVPGSFFSFSRSAQSSLRWKMDPTVDFYLSWAIAPPVPPPQSLAV